MSNWHTEVLSRPPIRIDDSTTADSIVAEFAERLEALLAAHNGLEATADGWRDLALALALEYEPAFQIETPADRESLGGRPAGWSSFILRSSMKAEMRAGNTLSQAAKIVSKKLGVTEGTARNAFSRKSSAPDSLKRQPYEIKAEKAIHSASQDITKDP
ncbi:hypothetical protein [Nitratireductor sp. GCM10026969]|uniref:hypothetical protein n=1 Tax=Nitratireductor sp. GCM10026969 TaxID=3252645 RepID=UPI00361AA499